MSQIIITSRRIGINNTHYDSLIALYKVYCNMAGIHLRHENSINIHIPANYNIFVSPTHQNSMTPPSPTASDAPVDSLRLRCSIISFEVVSGSKQIR